MEKRIAEAKRDSFDAGFIAGVGGAIDAMREVGIDEETRRRLKDALARRVWRNAL